MLNFALKVLGLKSRYKSIFDVVDEIVDLMIATILAMQSFLRDKECNLSLADLERVNDKVICATVLLYIRNVLFSKKINDVFVDLLHNHYFMKLKQHFAKIHDDDSDTICILTNILNKQILSGSALENPFRFGSIYAYYLFHTESGKALDEEITNEKLLEFGTSSHCCLMLYLMVIPTITKSLERMNKILKSRDFKHIYLNTNFALLETNLFEINSSRFGEDLRT